MKKKILSFILSMIMVICALSMTITATAIDTSRDVSYKITEELKEKLNEYTDDEYAPIYIWLDSVSDDIVYESVSKKVGYDVTAETEDAYINGKIEAKITSYKTRETEKASTSVFSLKNEEITTEKIKSFRKELGIPSVMTDTEIKTCIESGMSAEKIIEVAERNQFLADFRGTRKELNGITNTVFEKQIDKTKCKNIFVDPALPFITMECKKSYINDLAQFAEVAEIGYYKDVEFTTDETEDTELTTSEGATRTVTDNPHIVSGNYLMTPHDTLGYTGAGVKVGVLEVGNECNKSTIHLNDADITTYQNDTDITTYQNDTTTDFSHGTKVASIICGQPRSLNGITYQGIAPGATVYYASFATNALMYASLNWLVDDCECSVVNMSFGTTNASYEYQDKYMDCYVQQYRVIIVKSAGNLRYDENGQLKPNSVYVSSPGMAYNAITVGNVSNTLSNGKYVMSTGSSYQEKSFLTNKPDLSAFGTKITMLETSTSTWTASGTSYSAPMVTGTVALMLKANPKLVGKPDAVKTILIQTAEENKISLNNNGFVESVPLDSNDTDSTQEPDTHSFFIDYSLVKTEKAGSGLLNIQGAINGALSGRIISTQFDLASATIGDTWQSEEYYFPVGTDIEMVMVFEKYTHTTLTSRPNTNLELSIVSSGGTEVFKSKTVLDNVEVFNVSFATGGYYRFKIKILGLDSTTNDTIPSNLQTGHLSHNILKVSFMFACDCDNSKLVTSSYTETQHNVVCESCNQTILSRESHQTYTYSEGFFTEDGAYSILITHRYYVKNAQILTEQKTVGWAVAPCTYNFPATDATCNISLYSEEYVDDGYEVVYKIDIIKNGVILETFYSNSILVITAEGNATMIING